MELWIARDKNYNLCLYENKPVKFNREFISEGGHYYAISNNLFPEVTYENSPRKVKIELV